MSDISASQRLVGISPLPEVPDSAFPTAIRAVRAQFPWIAELGISNQMFQQWGADFVSPDQVVQQVRSLPAYERLFPGIKRADGTLRMNEAEYAARRSEFQQILRAYGRPDYDYDDPADTAAFFEQDIDPNELEERFEIYESIKNDPDVRDNFYVYAGMDVTVDDLYEAVVHPDRALTLAEEYEERRAASAADYGTFITRATEVALRALAQSAEALPDSAQSVVREQIANLSPDIARTMVDALYHGGNPEGGRFLELPELKRAFEYAAIGAAATQSGFALPTKERVEQIRQAGIDRAKAAQGYAGFFRQKGSLSGAVQRANLGSGFTQDDFERAVFLNEGKASDLLARAQSAEQALGREQGGMAFSQGRQGQFQQRGFRSTFS